MTDAPSKRPRAVAILLVVLPLWLAVSGAAAVWFFLRQEKRQAVEETRRFSQSVSATMIADDLRKIVGVIGERNLSSEDAARNLTRAASMIEGMLGPGNIGFKTTRHRGPADHPLIQVTLRGTDPETAHVWVVCSYDSRPGTPGVEANATGLAATLAAAQALAGHQPVASTHFLFIPHANDPDSPVVATAAIVAGLVANNGTAPSSALLCVEAMGAGEELWLSSRMTDAPPLTHVGGLGQVKGVDVICLGDDVDLASVLFESGLPAVRVATRPLVTSGEPDSTLPSPQTVAASAGRLVELIRRCTTPPAR